MDRRELLRHGALASVGLAAASVRPVPVWAAGGRDSGVPRANRIIFFAYDGMTWEDLSMARYYAMRHRDRRLEVERLMATGASGAMLVHSLTSIVTDSSAASVAWSTGRKIVNQAMGVYPDGTQLTTILQLARDRGLATGLMTTTRITHATPAGWWAHTDNRERERDIALQYLDDGPDILLGGGAMNFTSQDRDLFSEFEEQGYQVLRSQEDLRGATGNRLLGAFTRDHLPYEIDRMYQGAESPSLADLVRKGLEVLDGSERGFVAQIEAGRVDHANHQNDPGAALWEILAGDEALGVAMDYVDRRPGTLLIVGVDHATGCGGVYGRGTAYRSSNEAFDQLTLRRSSYNHLRSVIGSDPSPDVVRDAVRELMGLELADADVARLVEVASGDLRLGHPRAHGDALNTWHQALTLMGGNSSLNVNYATGNHTASPVPVAIYGSGVPSTGLGVIDNTDLFNLMVDALGISFQNPYMSEAEALQLGAVVPAETRPHWA
ncbi:MAG TPA: alkaline phosphatase [Longimicrobiales bacterium]|nr:alkaline phosphatase [Longimicrobiales bacterium]